MTERTINDVVTEWEEQGEDSQWVPEQETEVVVVEETEVVWGTNVRGVKRHTRKVQG